MNQQRMGNPASRMGPQQRQPQGPGPRTQPFKITPSARNPPGAGAPAPPTGAERGPGGAVAGSGQESLSLQQLTAAEPHQQKQIIGEHLYRQIFSMYPTFAGKITGKCSTPQHTASPALPSPQVCCWRWTTVSCCTCWSPPSLSRRRSMKLLQYSRSTTAPSLLQLPQPPPSPLQLSQPEGRLIGTPLIGTLLISHVT